MTAITLNIVVQGILTGLVYGLMALGLSVIFGVMRVVNFAHGEFTVVAMYAAFLLFDMLGVSPLVSLLPIAAAFFFLGYVLQRALVEPFISRAEHEQFLASVTGLDLSTPFAAYVRLIDSWRVLPYIDPGLPPALLPADWPGVRSMETFAELSALLAEPAGEHVRSVAS